MPSCDKPPHVPTTPPCKDGARQRSSSHCRSLCTSAQPGAPGLCTSCSMWRCWQRAIGHRQGTGRVAHSHCSTATAACAAVQPDCTPPAKGRPGTLASTCCLPATKLAQLHLVARQHSIRCWRHTSRACARIAHLPCRTQPATPPHPTPPTSHPSTGSSCAACTASPPGR